MSWFLPSFMPSKWNPSPPCMERCTVLPPHSLARNRSLVAWLLTEAHFVTEREHMQTGIFLSGVLLDLPRGFLLDRVPFPLQVRQLSRKFAPTVLYWFIRITIHPA